MTKSTDIKQGFIKDEIIDLVNNQIIEIDVLKVQLENNNYKLFQQFDSIKTVLKSKNIELRNIRIINTNSSNTDIRLTDFDSYETFKELFQEIREIYDITTIKDIIESHFIDNINKYVDLNNKVNKFLEKQ